jgi:hypothetical protein
MKRGVFLFVLVVAAAVTFGVVGTPTAPAGGTPTATMNGLLEAVTDGGNAVYTTSYSHSGKSQTHVRFHNPIPENAEFVDATCTGQVIAGEFVCDPIKLKKGETAEVTIVLEASGGGSSDCDGSEPCLVNSGYWTSDAGTNAPQKPKKIADVGPVETALLAGDDENKAATYALDACDPEGDPTVATNPDLDGETNPLASEICIPGFDPFGLVTDLTEDEVDEGDQEARIEVCVAETNCEDPFEFEEEITFEFRLVEVTFFPDEELVEGVSPFTQVTHDGDPVDPCEEGGGPDPCADITSEGGITTVIAKGTENGLWVVD